MYPGTATGTRFPEYMQERKSSPIQVGVKNNQLYAIREESSMPDVTQVKRKLGGQPDHTGHHRKIPGITERIRSMQTSSPALNALLPW